MPASRDIGGLGDAISGTANVNFDANTLFIDGVNNRVGVGTAAPSALLHARTGASDGTNGLLLEGGATNKTVMIRPSMGVGNNNNLVQAGDGGIIFDGGSINTGAFVIAPWATSTSGMRIDASGRVTMPAQPMFMGFPTNDYSTGGMPTGVLPFTASYNNGSHYNAATSRFTAPVTGWYRTTWGGLQLAGAVISLQVNGTRVYNGNHYNVTTPTYITMTQTVLRTLNAGDYLTVEGWNGGGYYNAWYLWSVELVA